MTSSTFVRKVQCMICILDEVMSISSDIHCKRQAVTPVKPSRFKKKKKEVFLLLELDVICQRWRRVFDSVVNVSSVFV